MKTFKEFFAKEKEVKKHVLREKMYHKMWGYQFCTKEMEDRTLELWVHSTWTNAEPENYFLGEWIDDDFVESKYYRSFPGRIRRGAERMRRKLRGLDDSGWADV